MTRICSAGCGESPRPKRERLETDRAAMLALPAEAFEARRVATAKANSLVLVRFDRNDYSVPTAFAHTTSPSSAGSKTVRFLVGTDLVATHARCWEKEQVTFDPRHYLALLGEKARCLRRRPAPRGLGPARVLLGAAPTPRGRPRDGGTREFIKVLRSSNATFEELTGSRRTGAGRSGRPVGRHRAASSRHATRRPVGLFSLDGHPHLKAVAVEAPDLGAYGRSPSRRPEAHTLGADRAVRERNITMKTLETKSMVLLRHHLKALRLPTIGAECEKVAAQAATDNVDHLTYLLQLFELELLDREKRSAERRMKAARFPTIKTLDTFDFAGATVGQQDAGRRAGAL